jgi:hypothetical protein
MKLRSVFITFSAFLAISFLFAQEQQVIVSASDFLVAQPAADRTVTFNTADEGVSTPIIWGLDLAWLSESNVRRGIAFMGIDNVDIIRASFQPTLPLINDDIQGSQITDLNKRLKIIDLTKPTTEIMLNCDHPSVHAWYERNPAGWAKLIDATARRVQEHGRKVVSVSPFNEPDFGWGQGNMQDFYNIAGELRKIPRFDSIRISGGNTLNCDQALPWYNFLKSRLDEGNTHQLAGVFDTYANFFREVRNNGHHATADELHNVMEAMVGVEYGMQTGVWWGTAEYARGEFVKASRNGKRLGYAEHRTNWTSAAVYRNEEGKLQAFGGTSERQAATTSYRFLSKDKPVFFDGYGPQREYVMELPGGKVGSYQQGQTNAERVVNISWGDDIQPVIDGKYILVNRNSTLVMEVANASLNTGANVRQNQYSVGAAHQQWNVVPVDSRVGGDFSYFTITAVNSGNSLDIHNWSLSNNGNIMMWEDTKGGNQQWYLEYAGDGWFYIRSRHSAMCIDIQNGLTVAGANVAQYELTGDYSQQWRFLPIDAPIEFDAPSSPANLSAVAQTHSVLLAWESADEDTESFIIFRSDTPGENYETIARDVQAHAFVDNTALPGKTYYYAVKAIDRSLNRSGYSNEVSAEATGGSQLIAHYTFEDHVLDASENLLHGAVSGRLNYTTGKVGNKAGIFNNINFVQLPTSVADFDQITVATWVFPRTASQWQRIFDFGNGESENMFVTPRSNTGKLRFAIKNGAEEQELDADALPLSKWSHLAVTLGNGNARIYVNGEMVAESHEFSIKPSDFSPVLNYLGRSQYPSDPNYTGYMDDFRIYNYILSAEEIQDLTEISSSIDPALQATGLMTVYPNPAYDIINISYDNYTYRGNTEIHIVDLKGQIVKSSQLNGGIQQSLDISKLEPGVYFIRLSNSNENIVQKLVIK